MTTDAQYNQAKWKQYRDARAYKAFLHGLCSRCVRIPPAVGRKMCVVCAEDHREIFNMRKQVADTIGHCVVCTKRRCVPGKMKCKRCAKVTAVHSYQRRLDAKAQGLCQQCVRVPSATGKLSCQRCIDRVGLRNRARRAQLSCKPKEPSGIINESVVNHENGDTNGQVHKDARSKSSQSKARQVRRQGKVRAEGQSQGSGQDCSAPTVLGLSKLQHRPQRSHLQGLATVAVFAVTFGLLIAGMLR